MGTCGGCGTVSCQSKTGSSSRHKYRAYANLGANTCASKAVTVKSLCNKKAIQVGMAFSIVSNDVSLHALGHFDA
jgi:hypothetical protein